MQTSSNEVQNFDAQIATCGFASMLMDPRMAYSTMFMNLIRRVQNMYLEVGSFEMSGETFEAIIDEHEEGGIRDVDLDCSGLDSGVVCLIYGYEVYIRQSLGHVVFAYPTVVMESE